MEGVKLPTLEDFLNAFEATGLKPVQGITYKSGCACALGALYAQKGFAFTLDIFRQAERDFGGDFVDGFVHGFDDLILDPRIFINENFRKGYDLGKSVWKKVSTK